MELGDGLNVGMKEKKDLQLHTGLGFIVTIRALYEGKDNEPPLSNKLLQAMQQNLPTKSTGAQTVRG